MGEASVLQGVKYGPLMPVTQDLLDRAYDLNAATEQAWRREYWTRHFGPVVADAVLACPLGTRNG